MTDRHFLLVTTDDPTRPAGGRELLSRLFADLLGELTGGTLSVERLTGRARYRDAIAGRLHGLDAVGLRRLHQRIGLEAVTDLILDGSNLGAAAMLKRDFPTLRVTTLFHNAETRFFAARLKVQPGLRALAVWAAHRRAEAMAMRYSDCRIALCERDSMDLERVFSQRADVLWPVAVSDTWRAADGPTRDDAGGLRQPYLLFVGGGFFGNIEGLAWYAAAVAPHLSIPTVVVGRGLGALAGRLGPMVDLVGEVKDLAPYYAGACLVVAPILSGSGMKTKVAEALMHGKRVVGTPEAFTGYGDAILQANDCCGTAPEMIAALQRWIGEPPPVFDSAQRELYLAGHSRGAALARLERILL